TPGSQTITVAQYGTGTPSQSVTITVVPHTVAWINPSGGDWDTAANWKDDQGRNRVPTSTDAVMNGLGGNGFNATHAAGTDSVYSLTSQDALVLSGGSLSVAAGSTIDNGLTVSGGTLGGTGDVTVAGPMVWENGVLMGSGTVTVDGQLTFGWCNLVGRTLVTTGRSIWDGREGAQRWVDLLGGAQWINRGDMRLNAGGLVLRDYDGTGQTGFRNEGSLLVNSASTALFQLPSTNGGSIEVDAGGISLNMAVGTHGGTFTGLDGTSL